MSTTGNEPLPQHVRWPKKFLFPVKPRGPVQLDVKTIDGESYTLLVGGVGPLSERSNSQHPCLTIRHLRLILRMIGGKRFDAPEVPINVTQLMGSTGQVSWNATLRGISELANTWLHRIKDGKTEGFRLMEFDTQFYYRQGIDPTNIAEISCPGSVVRRYLRSVRFNQDLWRAFLNWQECWNLRADVIDGISSDLAAVAFMNLSPKAHNPDITPMRKGRKDAATLLMECGVEIPKHLSDLRRIFERDQGRGSVLRQLEGLQTPTGYFMVDPELEENSAGNGYNVLYWLVRDASELPAPGGGGLGKGSLFEYWVNKGLPPEDFQRAKHPEWAKLEPYEIERIQSMGYPVEPNLSYLEVVRSFIGPVEFGVMIGTAAIGLREGQAKEGPGKYFGAILRGAYRDHVDAYMGRKR